MLFLPFKTMWLLDDILVTWTPCVWVFHIHMNCCQMKQIASWLWNNTFNLNNETNLQMNRWRKNMWLQIWQNMTDSLQEEIIWLLHYCTHYAAMAFNCFFTLVLFNYLVSPLYSHIIAVFSSNIDISRPLFSNLWEIVALHTYTDRFSTRPRSSLMWISFASTLSHSPFSSSEGFHLFQ